LGVEAETRISAIENDNSALRAEVVLAYDVIDKLPDSALQGIEEAQLSKLLRGMEQADRHHHVQSKVDKLHAQIGVLTAERDRYRAAIHELLRVARLGKVAEQRGSDAAGASGG
jgi:hypothetical protein